MSTVPVSTPAAARAARIDLIFFDAGGGHRASATALKTLADSQQRGWQIRMVNLRDILEPIDVFHRLTGVRVEDLYNRMLKYGLTIGTAPMLRAVQFLIRRMHPRNVALLSHYWREHRPDLVVSLIPNFNRAIFESLRIADRERASAETPMVTILTDLADYPPHFWIERQAQYVICGTAKAAGQALAMGYPARRVLRTSGMIVRPEFYQPLDICREHERRRLGLDPHLPTGLVMFGGFGSRRMLTIARRVAEAGTKTQFIFLCGHNQRLRKHLSTMRLPFPCHVEGFTRDIPRLMRLSDYFVGKPGPGSVSEALVMNLPVIVERNARTMVQERYNTEWIERHELGVVLRSFNEVAVGIGQMLDSRQLAHFRARAAAVGNRAVFEIPDLLAKLVAAAPAKSAPAVSQAMA
jgi:UDP-N-acetylglucosamine:LPS N-acetylglucosamine transferase